MNTRQRLILAAALVLIGMAFAGVIARRKPGSAPTSVPAPAPRPSAPEVALRPLPTPVGPLLSEFRHESDAIRFKLRLEVKDHPPRLEEPIVFCVPEGREVWAEIESYTVKGKPFPVKPPEGAPPPTASPTPGAPPGSGKELESARALAVKPLGVMRRWPLASLELKADFLLPFSRLPQSEWGDVEARIALRWKNPFQAPAKPPFPAECDPKEGWGRVGALMAANADGLALYQLEKPPAKGGKPGSGMASAPAPDWKLLPGPRRWARLRLKDEGFYRLKVEDLIAVGFPAGEVKPAAVRVFSEGSPVSLTRVGAGDSQKIHLWHPKPTSPYSAERTYWVTLAPEAADPAPELVAAEALKGEPQLRPTTVRTAICDRDNQLKIESGNFLAIKNIDWVDAALQTAKPLSVPLKFPAYHPEAAALDARARFYFEGAGAAVRHQIELRKDGKTVASTVLSSSLDVEKGLPIPSNIVKEGENAFEIAISPAGEGVGVPAGSPPSETVWFDKIAVDYPSRPALVDGRLTLRDPKAAKSPETAWTELAPEDAAPIRDALALQIGPDGRAIGRLAVTEREGKPGLLWLMGDGRRAEIARLDSIPLTPPFQPAEIDDLLDEKLGADYLVIAHRDFIEPIKPLIELHERQGMRVKVVDVQSVYDCFSHGDLTPFAIRDFLAYTLDAWRGGAPSHVLLVGDCSSDYLGLTKTRVRNWVPSYTYDAGPDDWASDHWMAATSGEDDMADFMLGRISVNNRADAEAIAKKIVDYVERPKPGAWRARMGFVSDNGGFIPSIEEIRKQATPGALEERLVYLDEEAPLEDNYYLPRELVAEKRLKVSPILTARLRETIRGGVACLAYYGHGSPNIWMEERVWFGGDSANSDNLTLEGGGYPAFVTTMTCNTGAIDYPVPKGLPGGGWDINISEDMMRVKDGGAIALFVPSGPSITSLQQKMAFALHHSIFTDGLRRLGEFTALAKARYSAEGTSPHLPYMFILLGDPAMDLALTPRIRTFDPPTRALRPGEAVRFDVVKCDPAEGSFEAAIDAEDGHEIARAEARPYSGGRIAFDLPVPADAKPGKAHARIHAWGTRATDDFAASGDFEIGWPRLELAGLKATREASGAPKIEAAAAHRGGPAPGKGRLSLAEIIHAKPAPLEGQPFTLDADRATTLTFWAPVSPERSRARVFEATLAGGDPPAAGQSATTLRRRVAFAPSAEWTGLVPELSRWKAGADERSAQIEAAVVTGDHAPAKWRVGVSSREGKKLAEVALELRGGAGSATLTLAGENLESATSGTLWLAAPVGEEGRTTASLPSLPLGEIPRPKSRLRIVPESIHTDPPEPFDGETILVRFEVENVGEVESETGTAGLYNVAAQAGGTALFDHIRGTAVVACDPLGPGDRRAYSMRWDPVDNAGDQEIWACVQAPRGRGASTTEDLERPVKLHVRKKANLPKGDARLVVEGEGAAKKYWLETEVKNDGETNAFSVMVLFFRSDVKVTENQIGEATLPVVPAGQSLLARAEWKPTEKDLAPGVPLPQPTRSLKLNWRRSFEPAKGAAKK